MITNLSADGCTKSDKFHSGFLKAGVIAGLASTIVMDIIMTIIFILTARPAGIFFSFISDALVASLAIMGITLKSGPVPGAILHYLIGLSLGLIYGYASKRFECIWNRSVGTRILFSILYVEIMSIFLLIPTVLILHLNSAERRELFIMALVLHAIWGVCFGAIFKSRIRY